MQVEAEVRDVLVQFRPRRQLVARVADSSGELVLRFLNFYGSQIKQLERARDDGRTVRLFGEIRHGFLGAEMVHPRYRVDAGLSDDSRHFSGGIAQTDPSGTSGDRPVGVA